VIPPCQPRIRLRESGVPAATPEVLSVSDFVGSTANQASGVWVPGGEDSRSLFCLPPHRSGGGPFWSEIKGDGFIVILVRGLGRIGLWRGSQPVRAYRPPRVRHPGLSRRRVSGAGLSAKRCGPASAHEFDVSDLKITRCELRVVIFDPAGFEKHSFTRLRRCSGSRVQPAKNQLELSFTRSIE
jgi:hypothetical protein